jgi:hypothetical protein
MNAETKRFFTGKIDGAADVVYQCKNRAFAAVLLAIRISRQRCLTFRFCFSDAFREQLLSSEKYRFFYVLGERETHQ